MEEVLGTSDLDAVSGSLIDTYVAELEGIFGGHAEETERTASKQLEALGGLRSQARAGLETGIAAGVRAMAEGGDVSAELERQKATTKQLYDVQIEQARALGLEDVAYLVQTERDGLTALLDEVRTALEDAAADLREELADLEEEAEEAVAEAQEALDDVREEHEGDLGDLAGQFEQAQQDYDSYAGSDSPFSSSYRQSELERASASIQELWEQLVAAQDDAEDAAGDVAGDLEDDLGDLQDQAEGAIDDTADEYAHASTSAENEAKSEHTDAVHEVRTRAKELLYEVRTLEAELAAELAELEQEYGSAGITGFSQFLALGGLVRPLAMAAGGTVPMLPGAEAGRDSVLAKLTPGEVVLPLASAAALGPDIVAGLVREREDALGWLHKALAPGYAEGGVVGGDAVAALAAPQASGEAHTLTFDFGRSGAATLRGEGDAVRSVVDGLRRLQRGMTK
jgi:uncharacterized protein YjbJ (UPF0337 family)